MQEKYFDTVIISDLHLGSEVSRAAEALGFLQGIHFRRLILLGDIFADLNFRRLTKEHWKFLGYIRKLLIAGTTLKWSGWKAITTMD